MDVQRTKGGARKFECQGLTSNLKSLNGGEYVKKIFKQHLAQSGIRSEFTVAGNPKINGLSKRFGGIVWTKA